MYSDYERLKELSQFNIQDFTPKEVEYLNKQYELELTPEDIDYLFKNGFFLKPESIVLLRATIEKLQKVLYREVLDSINWQSQKLINVELVEKLRSKQPFKDWKDNYTRTLQDLQIPDWVIISWINKGDKPMDPLDTVIANVVIDQLKLLTKHTKEYFLPELSTLDEWSDEEEETDEKEDIVFDFKQWVSDSVDNSIPVNFFDHLRFKTETKICNALKTAVLYAIPVDDRAELKRALTNMDVDYEEIVTSEDFINTITNVYNDTFIGEEILVDKNALLHRIVYLYTTKQMNTQDWMKLRTVFKLWFKRHTTKYPYSWAYKPVDQLAKRYIDTQTKNLLLDIVPTLKISPDLLYLLSQIDMARTVYEIHIIDLYKLAKCKQYIKMLRETFKKNAQINQDINEIFTESNIKLIYKKFMPQKQDDSLEKKYKQKLENFTKNVEIRKQRFETKVKPLLLKQAGKFGEEYIKQLPTDVTEEQIVYDLETEELLYSDALTYLNEVAGYYVDTAMSLYEIAKLIMQVSNELKPTCGSKLCNKAIKYQCRDCKEYFCSEKCTNK